MGRLAGTLALPLIRGCAARNCKSAVAVVPSQNSSVGRAWVLTDSDTTGMTDKKFEDTSRAPKAKVPLNRGARSLLFGFAIALAASFGALLGAFGTFMREMPQIGELDKYRPRLNTRVYASGGQLIGEFTEENRVLASLSEMPDALRMAVISIEDQHFYDHHGLDLAAIVRASIANIRAGTIRQGASTITQQLARNLPIGLSRARTFKRKAIEAVLALQIERKFTKDEILEMYLNQVYLGHRAYGVEAGARTYFGKHVRDLTLAECALLAGMPKAPSRYDPFKNPDLARRRRNTVLAKMRRDGLISDDEYDQAVSEPVLTGEFHKPDPVGPYFVEYVRQQLLNEFDRELVYTGGLTVKTTLDVEMQKAAEQAVQVGLERYMKLRQPRPDAPEEPPQVALVAIDPRNGYIRAMVGGRDYHESVFNRAVQGPGRQPGSAFKPIIWATAFEQGYTPADIVTDAPIRFGRRPVNEFDQVSPHYKLWEPKNFENRYFGDVTLRHALEESMNVCAIKLLEEIGISRVRANARRLGIDSHVDYNLSIALGTSVVRPIEMAAAYGTFANQGVYHKPAAILEVTDLDGNILKSHRPVSRVAISKETAFIITHVLEGVIDRGTGSEARVLKAVRPAAAGKTGTTDHHRDAWFVGYTPQLVCAVWVGYDDNSELGKTTDGRAMTGGRVACPIWADFMLRALEGEPVLQFVQPPGVVLVPTDTEGFRMPSDATGPIMEAFLEGTEPPSREDGRDRRRRVGKHRYEGRFDYALVAGEERNSS